MLASLWLKFGCEMGTRDQIGVARLMTVLAEKFKDLTHPHPIKDLTHQRNLDSNWG